MKKNNKGFMLAEVIITSVVILSAMVGLYSSFNRIYRNYQAKNNYYTLDGIYGTKEMMMFLTKNNVNNFINENLYNANFYFIIKNKTSQSTNPTIKNFSTELQNLYSIDNLVIAEYDKIVLENLKKTSGMNQTFKDYIDYVIGHYNIESATLEGEQDNYHYIFLTEITDEESKNYYTNLVVR